MRWRWRWNSVCATSLSGVERRAQAHARQVVRRRHAIEARFDPGHHALGFFGAAVRHQPARAFRNPQPHEEYDEGQGRTDQEGEPPAVFRIDQRRIEHHQRAERAHGRADPEAAVDDEIGPAAHTRRDQLLDGGIDRGIFAADAGAGDEAKQREAEDIPGGGGGRGGGEIDRQRDEEQRLAAEPVGEPAEEERAEHRAGQIGAAGEPDVGVGEAQGGTVLQRARQAAGERHLQPVQDPGDAERRHHQRVEAAPGQAVEPRRDVGVDDAGVGRHAPSPFGAPARLTS